MTLFMKVRHAGKLVNIEVEIEPGCYDLYLKSAVQFESGLDLDATECADLLRQNEQRIWQKYWSQIDKENLLD